MAARPVNFSPGPAILAQPVLERAARAVLALDDVGLSVLEISHRSKPFDAILEATEARLRRLMGIPDSHAVLFLQGGARGQFAQVPLSYLSPDTRAAYVDTGVWSTYAYQEAQTLGAAYLLASGREGGYTALPSLDRVAPSVDTAYVHTTSNNTIYGSQWQEMPDFGAVPQVCDMSSDILSRPVDVSRFALIYAGAQKNAGPSGVTLAIIDRAFMEAGRRDIPKIWQYRVHAAKGSCFNTPPTFAIYCVGLVLEWLEGEGGVDAIAARNEGQAQLIYGIIDGSGGFYRPVIADPAHRSRMNVTFRLATPELEQAFLAQAAAEGLSSLKGHREAGGLRASIYNQMPDEGVERLADMMRRFHQRHG